VAAISSTTRFEQVGSRLANQIDSVEACFAGTGTSEINDSPHHLAELARKRKRSLDRISNQRSSHDFLGRGRDAEPSRNRCNIAQVLSSR